MPWPRNIEQHIEGSLRSSGHWLAYLQPFIYREKHVNLASPLTVVITGFSDIGFLHETPVIIEIKIVLYGYGTISVIDSFD